MISWKQVYPGAFEAKQGKWLLRIAQGWQGGYWFAEAKLDGNWLSCGIGDSLEEAKEQVAEWIEENGRAGN